MTVCWNNVPCSAKFTISLLRITSALKDFLFRAQLTHVRTHKRVFDGTADVPIVLFCLYFNFFGRPLICFVHVPEPRTYAEPWTVMNSFVLRPRFEYPNPPTHTRIHIIHVHITSPGLEKSFIAIILTSQQQQGHYLIPGKQYGKYTSTHGITNKMFLLLLNIHWHRW